MKQFILLAFVLLLGFAACREKGYPKPKQFLNEKELVNLLYDIHLGEALTERSRYNYGDSLKIESNEMYQAILSKYQITDSVLSLNLIYYSSRPKEYEKIYTKVIDRLNMVIEQDKTKEDIKLQEGVE
ncbi:MAG: DUF4296 domain-containing protein [Mangrovibacterium sp.]